MTSSTKTVFLNGVERAIITLASGPASVYVDYL
jgi:hypothetical protein